MILPDVNVLIYAHDEGSQFFTGAREWLRRAMESEELFLSWHTITGFLRLSTHPSASSNPYPIHEAIAIVDGWLERENVHLISLEKKNWPILRSILIDGQANGNLVMDAHIAAMAASCGSQVATTDRDFSRFENIKTINPLKKTR